MYIHVHVHAHNVHVHVHAHNVHVHVHVHTHNVHVHTCMYMQCIYLVPGVRPLGRVCQYDYQFSSGQERVSPEWSQRAREIGGTLLKEDVRWRGGGGVGGRWRWWVGKLVHVPGFNNHCKYHLFKTKCTCTCTCMCACTMYVCMCIG